MDKMEFVAVADLIPDVVEELPYATEDNFTGHKIYNFHRAWLRRGTAEKLALAQQKLKERGYRMKVWDAFRPLEAQFKMWEVCPNDDYVADPTRGGCSKHNRGMAVDVTLLTLDGVEVPMPTVFDDFTGAAHREAEGIAPQARANSQLLEEVMVSCGFRPYVGEWWHYNDCDDYPLDRDFCPCE